MTYDEFSDRLRRIKIEYESLYNKPLESIKDLESFLDRRLSKPRSKALKSLKGISF